MSDVKEFEEKRAPRAVKLGLGVGAGVALLAGLILGVFFGQVGIGVLLFALGAVLFAVRGYLNTGDKATAGALIFVALVAIGIQAVVYFLGP